MPGLESKIRVIHNPLDILTLEAEADKPVNHSWLDNEDEPVILAVGRLHPQKDYPTLLKAFNIVRQKIAARLVVLGEGPEKENLVQIAKDLSVDKCTDFVGFQKNSLAFMKRCAVYVLPSLWEGCPNTLMEALICAPRIVASDCQGASRLILNDGEIGHLVPPGDHHLLASAILKSLSGRPQTDKLKLRAKAFDSRLPANTWICLWKEMFRCFIRCK